MSRLGEMSVQIKCVLRVSANVALFVSLMCGCGRQAQKLPDPEGDVLQLASSEFSDNSQIPSRFTEDGDDVSPSLTWTGAPPETKSYALICDDPDAPSPTNPGPTPWVHWVLFNIPGDVVELPVGIERNSDVAEIAGAKQGVNSWPSENVGYRGPAPPPGSGTHRYFFRLYALDSMLELAASSTKQHLLDAMSRHIVGEGQLVGTYER